jgi:hypothetical protein
MRKNWILMASIFIISIALVILTIAIIGSRQDVYIDGEISLVAKTEDRSFLVYRDGKFRNSFLTGVNLGATKPGYFPGELAITKTEYLRWFKHIHDMNADVIRVYTTMKPDFYDALYEFNKGKSRPLYLMQGLWKNEDISQALGHAYANDDEIIRTLIQDGKDLVDIFHGNITLPERQGLAWGTYTNDISKYVIGWILGVEWDPHFVNNTNLMHPNRNQYKGNYIETTSNASPFEAFLTHFGDVILTYEMEQYGMMRPLSFSNWLTTDPLNHPNEPYPEEDMVSVNTEHIVATESFLSGLFASYHVYPYYPDFINHSIEYRSFIDESGKVNPYRAYLRDLHAFHTVPVMVAEFGIPASRGKAHDSVHLGFNQGFMTETEQGHALSEMIRDIYKEGYMGGLVFAWQDEWFKRTWNTMDFDLEHRRPFWSNVQTNEQMFGLMGFEPGRKERISYADGQFKEWLGVSPVYESENVSLSIMADERYLYLMIDTHGFDFENDTLWIPILTHPDQGNTSFVGTNLTFTNPADFLIKIKGQTESRILVDAYYDSFYYRYAEQLNAIPKNAQFRNKDSGIFNTMHLALSGAITLPQDQITLPFSSYETGKLRYGNANPKSKHYDSLSDFYHANGKIEIQIPWALLNISDPSLKMHLGDYYHFQGFESIPMEGIKIGAAYQKSSHDVLSIDMNAYSWSSWIYPTYHERLKASYHILKQTFKSI